MCILIEVSPKAPGAQGCPVTPGARGAEPTALGWGGGTGPVTPWPTAHGWCVVVSSAAASLFPLPPRLLPFPSRSSLPASLPPSFSALKPPPSICINAGFSRLGLWQQVRLPRLRASDSGTSKSCNKAPPLSGRPSPGSPRTHPARPARCRPCRGLPGAGAACSPFKGHLGTGASSTWLQRALRAWEKACEALPPLFASPGLEG